MSSIKVNENANLLTILRQTRESLKAFSNSSERIASGNQFESAGDDPGALGQIIFNESAVRGITKELRNLNEGISLAQITDQYLIKFQEVLGQLKELAIDSSSTEIDEFTRSTLNNEAQILIQDIDQLITQAEDQGINLTQRNPTLTLNPVGPTLPNLDLSPDVLGQRVEYTSLRQGVFVSPITNQSIFLNDVEIRATDQSDDTVSITYQDGSAIAKANAINVASYTTGVIAEVNPTVITGNRPISALQLTGLNYFSINQEIFTGFEIDNLDATHTLQEAINAEADYTGVSADLNSDGYLVLTADDGRNIQIRYANQEVLNAVGVTDKAGDLPNLEGVVALASTDRDLKGEVQLPITQDFQSYGGNVSVNGRFDASEDYVDFVAQVITAGQLGSAQIRLDRDPTSDPDGTEEYTFIQGTIDPNVDLSQVSGNFFTLNGGEGTVTAGGEYNEGLDRTYTITATQAGTTDGTDRATFEVTTPTDGVVSEFTASANTDILIANSRTGEDVFIQLSPSSRQSTLTSTLENGHTQDTVVTLGGTYTGSVDQTTTVQVTTSGRTQGTPQATVQVYHDGVAFGGESQVNGGTPIDIGSGQTLTINSDFAVFGNIIPIRSGTYDKTVTINSDPLNFTGIGDGTYTLRISQSGSLGEAEYTVDKTDTGGTTQLEGARVLNAGTVVLADGITFDLPDVPPTVGGTTVSTSHNEDTLNYYQAYNTTQFTGEYDGLRGDTSLSVRVKREGVVLASAESEIGRDDYALLEYRFGNDAYTGDLIAQEGEIALSNGVTFTLPEPSNATTLVDPTDLNTDFGLSASLSGASFNYDGTFDFDLDSSTFQIKEDVTVLFTARSSVEIAASGGTASGDILTVEVVGESGTLYQSTDLQPVSNTAYTLIDGLTLTFQNQSNPTSIDPITDQSIIQSNVHSLQVNDLFSVDLDSARFNVGDTYTVDVDSAHLQENTVYTIENLLGRFEVGDALSVDVNHAFQAQTYTLSANTEILNGLNLTFDQDGSFEIGDELRFQVRGYTENPIASGTYTYAISPTTFTVEITQTGDVNGNAQFQYTRADTGETVSGFTASTTATDLDDGVQIAFEAGRLYEGDQFFIDTFESLTQVFGGTLTLSSDEEIKIDYDTLDTDNLLGRINYLGDQSQVNAPGIVDNSINQILRKNPNTAIKQLDLSTQSSASIAVDLATEAMNSLSAYQSKLDSVRSLIEHVIRDYQERKNLKEEQLSEIQAVEVRIEAPAFINSLQQIKSQPILGALAQQNAQSLLTLVQDSLISPEFLKNQISSSKSESTFFEQEKDDLFPVKKDTLLNNKEKKKTLQEQLAEIRSNTNASENQMLAFQSFLDNLDEESE
jgi:flagellin